MNKIKAIIKKQFSSFAFYFSYLKYRIFLLLFLAIFVGLFDGLGITMFIPLLQHTTSSGADAQASEATGIISHLMGTIESFGLELNLGLLFIIMFSLFTLKGIFSFCQGYYTVVLGSDFTRKLRTQLIENLSTLKYEAFSKMNAGDIHNTLTAESTRVSLSFLHYFNLAKLAILLMVYFTLALINNFEFALMIIAGGGISNFVYRLVFRRTKKLSILYTQQSHSYVGHLLQCINFFKYLKATATIHSYKKRIEQTINELEKTQKGMGLMGTIVTSTRELLVLGVISLVIYIYVNMMGGDIASVFVSLILFYRGMNNLLGIQKSWNSYLNNIGSVLNIKSFNIDLKKNTEHFEEKGKELLYQDKLEISNLNFSYNGNDKPVLKNINLEIGKNQTIALVGESGSGKTTLANVISGLIVPENGQVAVDGTPLSKENYQTFRNKIGYITQESVVFNDTLFNNISMWGQDNEQTRANIQQALKQAHLLEVVNDLPQQENTPLGDRGVVLSGGQKQRVSIAREMYRGCEILILDEATSALDSETERIIQENIDALKGHFTIVLIAHRLSTVKGADYICLMKKGEIDAIGTFEELVNNNEQFRKMVELQEF